MEDDIKSILSGKHVSVDYVLDQHSAEELERMIPITKRTVCYICCAVLFDEEDRVLLVQEAKSSCYGQWYLPAGRLEPGETILEGTKREVKEEAGVDCDLTTLICAEVNGTWMRFTFAGNITGGHLKTLEEKDAESLQARFFQLEELPPQLRPTKLKTSNTVKNMGGPCVLRSNDIVALIKLGLKYKQEKQHDTCLPVVHPHQYIVHRFVIMDRSSASHTVHLLSCKKGGNHHIPARLGHVRKSYQTYALIASIFNEAFSVRPSECHFQICGLLGVEHRGTGQGEDGICITYLVTMNLSEGQTLPVITSTQYTWHPVTCTHLLARLNDGCDKKIVPAF